ncbi:MAG TPA: hypothetical protein VMU84_00175 [Thermoanaerobaculia bacterium]|nr:hypothetical protein [Thermoanaerobaculia bacterium]
MKKRILSLALVLIATSLAAQKPVDVTIKQVNDRRTAGHFSQLTITLELPKVKAADVTASRVLVSAAVDDTGRNLVDTEASAPQLESSQRMMSDKDSPASVSLTLKNPDRKAATVKEVRGEIELYMPAKDPNSIAEFPKFLSQSGKPLAHKALKANGVDIALVSAAQIAAEKKKLGDAKRKEYADSGFQGEELDSIVKSYLDSTLQFEEDEVVVRIKDPTQRIHEIVYVDAAGEVKRVSSYDKEGFTVLSTWGGKPQADWKLRVSLKTPKNVVRQPFAVANVPLP